MAVGRCLTIRDEKDAVKYKDVQDCFVAVKCVIF